MLSITTIQRLCKPLVLRRARRIVDSGDSIYKRRCRFDEGETTLHARVESSSSWDDAYRTSAVLNEQEDSVEYYECNCRPAHANESPCDHVAALLLDFCNNPNSYEGYDARGGTVTSRGVKRLIDQAIPVVKSATSDVPTELSAATVRLEAILAYEVGFSVRFRIAGSKGVYSLKSIEEFVSLVEDGAFASYGKRLAFVHEPKSFTPQARQVVTFLTKAIQNRRAYALERVMSRPLRGSSSPMLTREMKLSSPELWELLALYEHTGLLFEDRSNASVGGFASHEMRIVEADPKVSIHIEDLSDGGFELLCGDPLRVVMAGDHTLAWDANTLYRCSSQLGKNAAILSGILGDVDDHMILSDEDAPLFCATVLPKLEESAHVVVPRRLDDLRPEPCELRFYLDYDPRRSLVTCDAQAAYGDVTIPLMSYGQTAKNASASVVRDVATEARGRDVVRRYFAVREGNAFAQATGEDLGALVYEGVAALQEVGSVFAYPAFERLRNKARPRVRVGVSVHSRLLELSMKLEELPQEELVALLESYGKRRAYHQLSDGSVVQLREGDLDAAGHIVEELGLDPRQLKESVAVPAYKAVMLDGLLEEDDKSESFEQYVQSMECLAMGSWAVPASLVQVLRPYQQEGFRWLCGLADLGLGGILADEMGLGKSVQLISFLLAHRDDARAVGPSLIVCPSSLVYNWQAELQKFAPELGVCVVAGTPGERQELREEKRADVLITSYDLLRRDVADYVEMRLWCVVLDEAQYIKNPSTQAAQSVKQLDARHRFALTGTPVENRLSELWSIFDFLMPGLLGGYERFRERFERPIVEDEDQRVTKRLRESLRPFILRRLKSDVAADLPEKIEQVVRTHMGVEQRRLYDAQVQEVRAQVSGGNDSFGKEKFQILALITRLRQICCDPELLYEDYAAGSCKTETILTLVERVMDAGEKTLVFSQFTSYLSVLSAELDRRGIAHYVITGDTPSTRRMELVNAFNTNETPVFLISLKAGGTGLNLTGATVVVHADPWWNAAAQNQATDRAHRIGQTREVTVYKVIASDTIEEKILELQRSKAELADAVVQGDVSSVSLASLTREDLEELLG